MGLTLEVENPSEEIRARIYEDPKAIMARILRDCVLDQDSLDKTLEVKATMAIQWLVQISFEF